MCIRDRSGCVQQRDDVGIVIADRVQLVDPGVVRVVPVLVAIITGGKAPALSLIHI